MPIHDAVSVPLVRPEQIWAAIADVIDPELDTPLVRLGFVDRIETSGAEVRIFLKLPTFWCAPNFAYLMASDLAERARAVPGVASVQVQLLDHCAGEAISAAVNQGLSFAAAFPEEVTTDSDLQELRRTFLRKGFLRRQDLLLRRLLQTGLSEEVLRSRRLEDLSWDEEGDVARLCLPGATLELPALGKAARAYVERGQALGLLRAGSSLFVDEQGEPIPAGELQRFLRRLRSVRLSLLFNTAMCSALFRTRYQHASAETAHNEEGEDSL
ncbi:iron-sulfur cluster assembly protein [Thermogemmatispora sp.]|uniref:iron-sulfur cluster assembly protein n=1 Tax=Thermogemmatispora sp. TaxID=1968838 RepID=UPI001D4CECD3|nr:iron-sulfur cluster assembly protein [Thermogemmatispora sp.]MBX5451904.1 iron-sulfur cluster assembly protein [Thermogemmatispora sp.]